MPGSNPQRERTAPAGSESAGAVLRRGKGITPAMRFWCLWDDLSASYAALGPAGRPEATRPSLDPIHWV